MKFTVTICLFFQIINLQTLYAQPGGGGGIQIMTFLDAEGNNVKNDNGSLQILQYQLSNNLKRTKKEIARELLINFHSVMYNGDVH